MVSLGVLLVFGLGLYLGFLSKLVIPKWLEQGLRFLKERHQRRWRRLQ